MDEEGTAAGSSSQQHAQGTQESTQGATQPVVRDFITDIFGEDSDDENDAGPSSSSSSSNRAAVSASKPLSSAKDDDDGIFADSDDDAAPSSSTAAKTSRLRKGGISQAKPSSSSSSSSSGRNKMDDLFGDDDDDDDDGGHAGGRADKISKKKRRESGRDRPEQRLKKRRVTRGGGDGDDAGAAAGTDDAADDGDEYDSGDEVHRTAEDDNFIDDDDDLADIRGEYDAEDQIFDDERPAFHKKPPASSKRGSSGDSGGVKKGADDPFSKTLEAMKKPKQKEMSDNEKDKVADQLLRRMGEACVRDDACFREGQPAVHKLQLLKTVQSVVAVKALQHTLLERDLLGALRDWIEPKNDAQKTLPSLAIRTAVYEILMKLPCHTDQLKRSDGLKKPIGHVVLALRKHKQETPENKRLLKELMEKWCRPVFRKSADARNMVRDQATEDELAHLAAERERRKAREAAAAEAAAAERAQAAGEAADARGAGDLEAVLAGQANNATDTRARARAPYSTGFLFTVKPEEKTVHKKESNEKVYGQTRAELMKKLHDQKGKAKKGGVKANPRAMDMAMTGRNKA